MQAVAKLSEVTQIFLRVLKINRTSHIEISGSRTDSLVIEGRKLQRSC